MKQSSDFIVLTEPSERFCFSADPKLIGGLLPENVIGTYLLSYDRRPFYIGRSDACLRGRLTTHEYLNHASHVIWEPCKNHAQAFYLECYWYHELEDSGQLINMIHPGKPNGTDLSCPFCRCDWNSALEQAIGNPPTELKDN